MGPPPFLECRGMQMDMQRGMRDRLDKYVNISQPIQIGLRVAGGAASFACFGVDQANRLSDMGYMVFENQQRSDGGEVTYLASPGSAIFTVDLQALPASVDRLVLTASLDGSTMGQVTSVSATISQNGATPLELSLHGSDFSTEKAVVLLEIYRKDGWRVMAVARGFNAGMRELLKAYGGEAALDIKPAAPPSGGRVELRKGQKVNLTKSGSGALGEVLINLNWSQPAPKRGLFGMRKAQAIDLDLGCLYELSDGTKGCVQALGNSFGSLKRPPYIALDGDDRSGESAGGENLRVNGAEVDKISRILVYTFIYDGAADWVEAKGVVTVKCPGSQEIVVRMDEYGSSETMCAIAMLENNGHGSFSVEKLVRFFRGHVPMDRAYGWNMEWVPGRKD